MFIVMFILIGCLVLTFINKKEYYIMNTIIIFLRTYKMNLYLHIYKYSNNKNIL